ncbi:FkbM family methyltransferase [Brevundimonas faecalis]
MVFAAKDPVIGQSLRLYGEWAEPELDVAARFIDGERCLIDVGANIGTHAIGFAHRFQQAPVIAVEPQPLAFTLLCANVVSFGQGNIEPVHGALGSRRGLLSAEYDYEAVGWNIGAVNVRRNVLKGRPRASVPIMTLDALVSGRDVQFIKIDVEGMEPQVLAGALETLRRCRPVILFEVLTISTLRRAIRVLDGLDYEFRWCETAAFNVNNFNGYGHNIWELGETSVLALPTPNHPKAADFPLVSGQETRIPRRAFLRGTPAAPAFVESKCAGYGSNDEPQAQPGGMTIPEDVQMTDTMTPKEILDQVARIISKLFRYPMEEIDMQTTAAEVNGWDSLSHVTFIMEVETVMGVVFDPYKVQDFASVGDLVNEVVTLK